LFASASLFDVERFRREPGRLALARDVARPTLVLGSTQAPDIVDADALRARHTELARRRGGGGAVYLEPGAQLWVDAWIPRDDPLWEHDVSGAACWVGAWWVDVLRQLGRDATDAFEVHTGRSVPGEHGDLVCFAGRGPGETFHDGRKVVGLSQWRAREGALFSSCAYLHWDPAALLALMNLDLSERVQLEHALSGVAVGLSDLGRPVDLASVRERLLASFPSFAAR
jgi:lipoate---protein ligase